MLSLIAAMALSATQPAGASMPLVVELCNATPARVAYSVVYPSGTLSQRRRGWLTVEAGECLSGAIGNTTGGIAYVHAMSGGYQWPAGDQLEFTSCLPASSHDSLAADPPCPDGDREAGFEAVSLERLAGLYGLTHQVSCDDLNDADNTLCQTGRQDEQGFAEPVRTLEICNFSTGPVEVAVAYEALQGSQGQLTGWTLVQGNGQCEEVWRGLFVEPVVHLHIRGGVPFRGGRDARRYCLPIEGDFDFTVEMTLDTDCDDSEVATTFRAVRYSNNVSHMSFDIGD